MKDPQKTKIKSTRLSRWLFGDWDAQINERKANLKSIKNELSYAVSIATQTRETNRLYRQVLVQRIVIAVLVVIVVVLVMQLVKNVFK